MIEDFNPELDLRLDRTLKARPELVFRCWTTPALLLPWFCPLPWKTVECDIDLRPGGRFFTRMQGPGGEDMPGEGCYLEITPGRKLVWTSCLKAGYRPQDAAGLRFTAFLFIEPHNGGTAYTAIARHGDPASSKQHAGMGFHDGWGAVAGQLDVFAQGLKI